jgi:hypothetical protein
LAQFKSEPLTSGCDIAAASLVIEIEDVLGATGCAEIVGIRFRSGLLAGGNRIRTIGPAGNGTAMGGPPKSILAISDLTLGGSTDRADVPIGNA